METNTPNKGKGDEIINSVENKYVNEKLKREQFHPTSACDLV